jgi:hypothetical protein
LLHKEKRTEIKRKLLADQEFEIEKKEKELSERKSKFDHKESSSESIENNNKSKQTPIKDKNDTLDSSIEYLIENLISSSTTDDIANVEADPSTFSNRYHHKLNPIQPKLAVYPQNNGRRFVYDWFNTHKWLEK